jgi:uncharacterized protein YigA (DUF484 family)
MTQELDDGGADGVLEAVLDTSSGAAYAEWYDHGVISHELSDSERLSDDEVVAYLLRHRDFFTERPEVLECMVPPPRWKDGPVVDLQRRWMETLRNEMAGLRDCATQVIETSRRNMATLESVHAAVLALLDAEDAPTLLRRVGDTLPALLDVELASLALEPCDLGSETKSCLIELDVGDVELLIGADRDVALISDVATIDFAACEEEGIRSAALVRVPLGADAPHGLLAFGSSESGAFHPRQGTELLRFLAQVVAWRLRRLLPQPA